MPAIDPTVFNLIIFFMIVSELSNLTVEQLQLAYASEAQDAKKTATAEKVAGFESRLAALETATAGLSALAEKVASLEKLEDTNRSRIENLENAMPVAGSGEGNVVVLGPLEARVAATETTLASLGDKVGDLSARLDEQSAGMLAESIEKQRRA